MKLDASSQGPSWVEASRLFKSVLVAPYLHHRASDGGAQRAGGVQEKRVRIWWKIGAAVAMAVGVGVGVVVGVVVAVAVAVAVVVAVGVAMGVAMGVAVAVAVGVVVAVAVTTKISQAEAVAAAAAASTERLRCVSSRLVAQCRLPSREACTTAAAVENVAEHD